MQHETSYFEDPQLDRAVGLVMQLAAELHVTTQRVHALEAVLVQHGLLEAGVVDAFQPEGETKERLAQVRDAAMTRLLRVVTEQGPAEHPLRDELVRAPGGEGRGSVKARHEDPVEFVDSYLQACEDRRLVDAAESLTENVALVFPGGASFASLDEMVAAAAGRYRWVRKHRDLYAVGHDTDGNVVVTSRGRLYGENLHGVAFDDVRYVDVFVLAASGRIAEQHVWNDFASSDVLDRRA